MEEIKPFEFKQCITILKATGEKARNLRELRDRISDVSDESISHHVYHYFQKEKRILEYTNDFAQWAGETLKENILAEQLSNIVEGTHSELVRDTGSDGLSIAALAGWPCRITSWLPRAM